MSETRQASATEWHPSQATIRAWGLLSLPVFVAGIVAYAVAATRGGSYTVEVDLLHLLLVLGSAVALFAVHEGIHGLLMALFGARPRFGFMTLGGSVLGAALYTTAPGYVFSRRQYLAVILAPTLLVSAAGIPACVSSMGGYLVLPFAVHLTGCIGDLDIARQTYRQPRGTGCEDLRDGVRFWHPA